ncbi:MAG TPA: baseplate J/gp47 family protein [Solirubrobacteraceae bacterium]|nr:baseplate J/gp47 family protein [Solirubrobacteraceae bacterium]
MSDFVDVVIAVDPTTLLDTGIDTVNANLTANGFPNWSPADATLAVITLGVIAQWAADIANVAATATPAIFRTFGTQLLGVPYDAGAYATVTSTWTFTAPAPTGGYTIPVGTGIVIDGAAFEVQQQVTTSTGATSASVVLVAATIGAAYNGLGVTVETVDQIPFVESITTDGATANGADQESDADYATKLAAILQLQAPRPITASDYAAMVLSLLCVLQTGITVGRATSIDGYYANSANCTANIANATATVTVVTPPFVGAIPAVGATVTGTHIPTNTTVLASPAPTTTSFTMSANATANATGETISISAWTNVAASVTTFVTDLLGNSLSGGDMTALSAWLEGFRENGLTAFVEPPSTTTIYVTAEIHVLPGFVDTAVVANVETALAAYLSPATWGNPTGGWLNYTQGGSTVRFNSIVGVIENVPGVQYALSGQVFLGTTASPSGTSDIALSGPAPLAYADQTTITVTADN